MKRKIALITDYLDRFGSKQRSKTYRSGLNIDRIIELFKIYDCEVKTFSFTDFSQLVHEKDKYFILYTSSEDNGGHYKSFIEDSIQFLSLTQHICIPEIKYLRAHNNKVFMEMLRSFHKFSDENIFNTKYAATKKEISNLKIEFPAVVKGPDGALSKSVEKVENLDEVYRFFSKNAPKTGIEYKLREYIRRIRHRNNYNPEELKRGKLIIQNFIPGINFDWKVLVYHDIIFALKRQNRKNDFRASGSGLYEYSEEVPDKILNLAWETRKKLNVPHLSLDIAETADELIIFEFQAIYFGTKTIENSTYHFINEKGIWKLNKGEVELEDIYVCSTMDYIEEKYYSSKLKEK